jgi:hypothetical protein
LFDGCLALEEGLFGDLQAARVLGTLRVELVEGPLEGPLRPRCATIRTADRGLEAVAQCRLVAIEVGQFVVADGRGRSEEGLRWNAG